MPYSITEEEGVFLVLFSGIVTPRELLDFAGAAWAIEQTKPVVFPRITDLSGVTTMELDFKAVWQLAEDRKRRTFPNAFKSAIVAPHDHLLGFARMFQTLNDHPQITIRIFRDLPGARGWIAER